MNTTSKAQPGKARQAPPYPPVDADQLARDIAESLQMLSLDYAAQLIPAPLYHAQVRGYFCMADTFGVTAAVMRRLNGWTLPHQVTR